MLLKESIKVGSLTLSNRLVMPPMATAKSGDSGAVTDALCEYYAQRAEDGHIGLIITEHSYICKQGQAGEGQASIADDSMIEGLKQLVDTIHNGGSKVIAQLNHSGSAAKQEITGQEAVAPSAVSHPRKADTLPRELTKAEIAEIEDLFAVAAVRAKAAGFDGVEIHAAHSYLFNQFYSPMTNKRSDEYGPQSVENRVRVIIETLKKVRAAVGEDYPIAVRLGGSDYMEGGSTIEDAVEACVLFEKAGVDLLDLSGGMCSYRRPGHEEAGYFSDMTSAIKRKVSVPIILTGGVKTIEEAERLLQEQCADLIGVGRALFSDADWAKKAMGR